MAEDDLGTRSLRLAGRELRKSHGHAVLDEAPKYGALYMAGQELRARRARAESREDLPVSTAEID